jgi:cytochrome P450 family 135
VPVSFSGSGETAVAGPSSPPVRPPGPRWPAPLQTVATVFFRDEFTRYCQRHFGSVITVRLVALGEFVVVSDPRVIREVFTGDPNLLRAGDANAQGIGALARTSVLVVDGEPHLRLRRLMLPPFHGEAVRRYAEVVSAITAAEIERWPTGEELALWPRMQAITLEAILRAVIGVRDEEPMRRLRAVLPDVLRVGQFAIFAETQYPRLAGSSVGRRLPWLRARREAYRLLHEEIQAHRALPDGREDVLALLMAARDEDGRPLDDEELRDQLITLLLAGHETTASALGWCFERLVRHPRVLMRLQRELGSAGGGDDGDGYLEAVINETLRVRPVIDAVARKLAAPLELADYSLPAGTMLAVSIIGVQGSRAFPEPDEFRPERLLGQPAPPYTLIPFGGGSRRCIGASFAMMEMKTVLRAVIEGVELRARTQKPERPTRWRRFTTVPGRGARVIVAAKRSHPDGRSSTTRPTRVAEESSSRL